MIIQRCVSIFSVAIVFLSKYIPSGCDYLKNDWLINLKRTLIHFQLVWTHSALMFEECHQSGSSNKRIKGNSVYPAIQLSTSPIKGICQFDIRF